MMNSNDEWKEKWEQKWEDKKCRGMGRKKWFLIPVFFAAIIALKSLIVFYLWNNLVPELFHGPEITYVHTIGLIILTKLLFGGMHGMHGWGGGRHRFGRHGKGPFGKHERWDGLSTEEREALREMIRERGEK